MIRASSLALALVGPVPALAQAGPAADPEIAFSVGLTHLREGRWQLALEELRKAVKQDPKNPYFQKGLGQACLSLNKLGDAEKAFRRALELNPYYVDVHNDLGTTLLLQGKREEGKREYLTAFNDPMNPTPELTARNLGHAYFDEKNYPEALNWFRTCMARNKFYPDCPIRLADTLVVLGQMDDAVAQLEAAHKAMPDELAVTLALGEAYYRAGRFNDARGTLEQVAGKDPAGPHGRRAAELLENFPK
ncbi:MAG: tetratricopeptide repeat protein [Acidobacteria bacterium]|nr:tetratricopeptide repeat protein [Acidobacteriota bacterium]